MRQPFLRLAMLLVLALSACAPRGEVTMADLPPAQAALVTEVPLFMASTRMRAALPALYGSKRAGATDYARFVISIPPAHQPGEIEWPGPRQPDPLQHFLTVGSSHYDTGAAFVREIDRELARQPAAQRDVVVFVHGYNVNFAEGLYRLAQMSADFELPGVAVGYSWPSAGAELGYVYDRDSVLTARDGLEQLLDRLAQTGARRIILVSHSLGAFLTMETLRQLRIAGNSRVMNRLGGVALMSPDIDIEVFRSQAERIGRLPQPFVIFSSRRDRALWLSAGLTGQSQRLGRLQNLEQLADLELTVIDTTNIRGGDALNHFSTATSPALIAIFRNAGAFQTAFNADQLARTGLLPGSITLLRNATGIVLEPLGL
jgi:esterase/lipase superfamily enzyme